MDHPILLAALAEDRRRHCSCGAMTQAPNTMCRGCRTAVASRHDVALSRDRTTSRWTSNEFAGAGLFTWVASLLHIGKGAES